ncbi:MAG: nucleoside-diphosphate kinase [Bacteroidales bacterium]|nr:nucleoside-diphosphate kinase [Candidatus Physcocola equi]
MKEKTLVILKPSCVVRGLVGEVTKRFEQKGLQLVGMKMCQLTDEQLSEHYGQHKGKPFFQQLKDAMMVTPVVVCCYEGVDAVEVVRNMAGTTNGRKSPMGTIRGDLCMSFQENIVHTSDSKENAEIELKRFFKPEEIFSYELPQCSFIYAADEV